MSDIRLGWNSEFFSADVTVLGSDLVSDDGLETAVLLSLFTDRRADDGDPLPAGDSDRRGFWGDVFPVVPGDKHGSKLWLLDRGKQTPGFLSRAEQYAREALQWMLDDRVASEVSAVAEFIRGGWGLTVTIQRPNQDPASFRYASAWEAQEHGV